MRIIITSDVISNDEKGSREAYHVIQNVSKLSLVTTDTGVSQVCWWSWGFPVSVGYTVIHNYNVSFVNRLNTCDNILVKHTVLFNL